MRVGKKAVVKGMRWVDSKAFSTAARLAETMAVRLDALLAGATGCLLAGVMAER